MPNHATAAVGATPTQDSPPAVIPLSRLLEQEAKPVPEIGGRKDGLDPTRYGDWEKNGRCIDF